MKAFISAIVIFVCLCLLVGIHTYRIDKISREILDLCNTTEQYAADNQWNLVTEEINRIKGVLNKNRLWSELTLPTATYREIDFSLTRSHAFAVLGQAPDFSGEFATFRSQIEYLLLRESFSPGEIF